MNVRSNQPVDRTAAESTGSRTRRDAIRVAACRCPEPDDRSATASS